MCGVQGCYVLGPKNPKLNPNTDASTEGAGGSPNPPQDSGGFRV